MFPQEWSLMKKLIFLFASSLAGGAAGNHTSVADLAIADVAIADMD